MQEDSEALPRRPSGTLWQVNVWDPARTSLRKRWHREMAHRDAAPDRPWAVAGTHLAVSHAIREIVLIGWNSTFTVAEVDGRLTRLVMNDVCRADGIRIHPPGSEPPYHDGSAVTGEVELTCPDVLTHHSVANTDEIGAETEPCRKASSGQTTGLVPGRGRGWAVGGRWVQ